MVSKLCILPICLPAMLFGVGVELGMFLSLDSTSEGHLEANSQIEVRTGFHYDTGLDQGILYTPEKGTATHVHWLNLFLFSAWKGIH
jgi:hypothetical protein